MPKLVKKTGQQTRGNSLQVPITNHPSQHLPQNQALNPYVNFVHPNEDPDDLANPPPPMFHPTPLNSNSIRVHTVEPQDDSKLPSFNELIANLSAAKLSPANSASNTPINRSRNGSRATSPARVSRRLDSLERVDSSFVVGSPVPLISLSEAAHDLVRMQNSKRLSGTRSPTLGMSLESPTLASISPRSPIFSPRLSPETTPRSIRSPSMTPEGTPRGSPKPISASIFYGGESPKSLISIDSRFEGGLSAGYEAGPGSSFHPPSSLSSSPTPGFIFGEVIESHSSSS